MTARRVGPGGLSGATFLAVGSLGGSVGRSSSSALGKVYIKAFLTADRVIAYIDRIIVRLLAEYGSLVPNRSYALYDTAISYYSGVDSYSPALHA